MDKIKENTKEAILQDDNKHNTDMFGDLFDYHSYYRAQYPTLSDHARKLNSLVIGKSYSADAIGKVFYTRLMNDQTDYIQIDDTKVLTAGMTHDIEDKKGFSKLVETIVNMQIGEQKIAYFKYYNNDEAKEYHLQRTAQNQWSVINTNLIFKNIRKEGGGTAPDPREDSLDYGARGGNSAAPTQFH